VTRYVSVTVDVAGLRLRADVYDGYLSVFEWDASEERWAWAANGLWTGHASLSAGETLGRGAADAEECLAAIDRKVRDVLRRAA
jgi:hypothetical protein